MNGDGPKTGMFRMVEVDDGTSAAALIKAGGFKIFDPTLLHLFPLEPTNGPLPVPVNFDVLDEEVNSIDALPLIRLKGKPPRFRVALAFAARFPDFIRDEPLVALVTKDGKLGDYVAEFSFFGRERIVRPVPATILWSKTRRYLFEM